MIFYEFICKNASFMNIYCIFATMPNSILYPSSLSSKIISLEIDNSVLVGETPKDKVSILDVKVTTNTRGIRVKAY